MTLAVAFAPLRRGGGPGLALLEDALDRAAVKREAVALIVLPPKPPDNPPQCIFLRHDGPGFTDAHIRFEVRTPNTTIQATPDRGAGGHILFRVLLCYRGGHQRRELLLGRQVDVPGQGDTSEGASGARPPYVSFLFRDSLPLKAMHTSIH